MKYIVCTKSKFKELVKKRNLQAHPCWTGTPPLCYYEDDNGEFLALMELDWSENPSEKYIYKIREDHFTE